MKRLVEQLTRTSKQSNLVNDLFIVLPRICCGLILAFGFGASKFGMPWTPAESNLTLFQVSGWFVEDVSKFGGLFTAFPLFFAWLAAASETIGALCLTLGFKTRISSFFILCTMLVAIFFQQWDNGVWAMLPALGFLWVSLYSLILGSGRFGLDYIINRKLKKNRLLTSSFSPIKGKIKTVGLALILLITILATAQQKNVTFKVDTRNIQDVNTVSIKGNIKPLSQNDNYQLTDKDGDGIYEATIDFKTSKKNIKFKFLVNGETELQGSDARVLWFKDKPVLGEYTFNEFNYYKKEKLDRLIYTDEQIEEDIAILKKIVLYVHPNVYKFRDSITLQQDFGLLEAEMKRNPTLTSVYGAISKFAAKIKCSHTFTNPWNQSVLMEKANFYQPDKIPFTFNRVGKRLFIDKNADESKQLKKGLEILSINGMPTKEVLSKLAEYVTSDGNNYEKKLERLAVTGEEKFSMFDIFYSIEFGSQKTFSLQLKDINTDLVSKVAVKAISKTNRTRLLTQRYGKLDTSLKDSWNFEIINDDVAKLSMKSFAVQRNEFDWQEFLDDVFKQLNKKEISNFIIDIRGNEGGQTDVGKYILERILQKPFKVKAMQSSVNYLEIPSDFKKHISTWEKFPYNFKGKIDSEKNGRYFLKEKYTLKASILQPKKVNFKGEVFLITDASNSSATHLMAAYAKQIENVTIVGQETGGNQMGTNGSFIFFLRLPNTKVELDIPVIHNYVPTGKNPIDGGIQPHINVEKKPQDFINNIDTELNTIMQIIKTK